MLFSPTNNLITEWYVTRCLSHGNCKSENLLVIVPESLGLAPGPRSGSRHLIVTLQILDPHLNIYHS